MNTSKRQSKSPNQKTGRTYASVAAMLEGLGASKAHRGDVAELERNCRTTVQLACMRLSAGITQEQMAVELGCTQSRISKLESGTDADLTLKDIRDYCHVTEQLGGLVFGQSTDPAETISALASILRDELADSIGVGRRSELRSVQAELKTQLSKWIEIRERAGRKVGVRSDRNMAFAFRQVHQRSFLLPVATSFEERYPPRTSQNTPAKGRRPFVPTSVMSPE